MSSLLACLATVSSPHALAETYTWLGGSVNIHGNTNWTPDFGGGNNWSTTWAGTATNTMLLDADRMTGTVKTLQASFDTLSIGGITVANGSDGFSVSKGGTYNRAINLRDGGSGYTLFDIGGDFSLGTDATPWANGVILNSSALFKIAAGKTMNIYGGLGVAGEGAKTVTVGADGSSGTLILNTAARAGMTADWVVSNGATVQLNNATALGTGAVALNGGNLKAQHDAVYANALTVSGSSGLTINAATQFSNVTLAAAGSLNMNGGALVIADSGSLTLGASGTITGNLTLGESSLLNFASLPTVGASLLNVTGTLTVNSELLLGQATIDGVTWAAGSYDLISANTVTGVPSNSFVLGTNLMGSWNTEGGKLSLVVTSAALLEWKGGDGVWSATAPPSSPWKGDGVYNNDSGVIMGDIDGNAQQTVTIEGEVSPTIIMVNAEKTDYVWNAATGDEGGSLAGDGNLEKTGAGKLTINTDNSGFSGKVMLGDGTIVMGSEHALGTGTLLFNGGILQYATGITEDVSSRISVLGTDAIRVDTNGNNVAWATYTQDLGNKAIVKLGEGKLSITVPSADNTYTGAITVEGGQLVYTMAVPSSQTARTWSGAITLGDDGTLQFAESRAASSMVTTLSGQITGGGTLILGDKSNPVNDNPGGGRFQVSGNNAGFTGKFSLVGNGTNATWNEVAFANAAAFGGASLELDGRGFYVNNSADPINSAIHVTAAGSWLNGNSGQTVTFGGALTSAAGANLGTTAAGNPTLTAIFTGNLTGFVGTMHTGAGNVTFSFGGGGAATTLETGEFLKAVSLGGNGTFVVNYSGTGKDLLYAGNIIDGAKLTVQGTDKLILAGSNTSTGEMEIKANASVQLGNGENTGNWNGKIKGDGSLVVNRAAGSPVLELNAENTYVGGTTLNGGTVKALGAGSLGTGNVSVNGGSVLDMNGQAIANNVTITKGGLQHAGAYATAGGVTVNAEANSGDIDLGGLSGDKVGSINTTTAGTAITGLTGNLTLTGNNSLHVGANNTTYADAGDQKSLLQFNDTATGTVSFGGDGSDLTLHMDIDTDILIAMRDLESVGILLTNGTITGLPSSDLIAWLNQHLTFDATLESLGFGIRNVDGGSIVISGRTDQIYIASVDGSTVTDIPALNSYAKVIVNTDLTLNFDVPAANTDKTIIRHLSSGTSTTGNLVVNATGDGSLNIELANDLDDSVFNGNLTVNGDGVDLIKTGEKTLALNGNVNTANAVVAREGVLALNGTANNIGMLTIASASADNLSRVVIAGTTTTTLADEEEGGSLEIASGGTLKTTGASTLDQATTISGAGRLNIQEGSSLTMTGKAGLAGTSVTLNGMLSLDGTGGKSILSLSGAGTLALNGNALSVTSASAVNGSFSGTLQGEGNIDVSGKVTQVMQTGSATYDLGVHGGGTLVLKGTSAAPTLDYRNVTVGSSGTLRLEAVGNGAGDSNTTLNVGSIDFQSGSTTEFVYNLSQADPFGSAMQTANSITIGNGAEFTLSNMTGNTGLGTYDNLDGVVLMTAGAINGLDDGQSMSVGTSGLFAVYYKDATMTREGGNIVLNATVQQDNIFEPAVNSHNSGAGSRLLWEARNNLDATSQLGQVMNSISTMITGDSPDFAGASRALAAVAGSTVNALGTAQRDALREQMGWIRNRTTLMGVNPSYVNEDMPYFHMW
ncbi:autotransporter-associated beta strand repeat-containing protein, partial [uncultured Akkermansia sp.]|uniref:beta strand repeat-containing protein n=1 Tax=uncultured Akkermansia sp. TaxID=512294 RepID=UPI00265C99CC